METNGNYSNLTKHIPENVTLVAVSKTKPIESIQKVYQQGCRVFGENKVQELADKHPLLPKDIQWHFIGHLQRNKVKYLTSFVHMIHSVDSLRLLKEINKQAEKSNRVVNCLLQFHIASEDTKFGLDPDEAVEMLQSETYSGLIHIRICGVMGMGTFTEEVDVVRAEFKKLKQIFDKLKSEFFSQSDDFKEISMGMSGDYSTAIEEGSTMVRIGSAIFGERDYH